MSNNKKQLPRGLRNRNPLNIRRTGAPWKGLAADQSGDKAFCVFSEMKYGWRAAFKLLGDTYYTKLGLRTLNDIIGRWAPPTDGNDTEDYISRVQRATCINSTHDVLPPPRRAPALWRRIAWAMAQVENGGATMLYSDMEAGFQLWVNGL